MTKKIYLVTSGCYSDYSVDAAFTTREKAQEFIDNEIATNIYASSEYSIEEYDVDEPIVRHKRWYHALFLERGLSLTLCNDGVFENKLVEGHAYVFVIGRCVNMYVYAETIDKAKAIAIERHNAWLAVKDTHTPLAYTQNIRLDIPYYRDSKYGHMYDLDTYEDVSMTTYILPRIVEDNNYTIIMAKE